MKDKVLCFGELFIDMFARKDKDGRTAFYQHAGGSPGIVAYALAGYGANSCLVGKLSDDHFANYLVDYMKNNNVNMEYAIRSPQHRCTISFVRHDDKGERTFEIYRDSHYAADLAFSTDDWQEEWFADAAAMHCGSNCQVSEESHASTLKGVQLGAKFGTVVSYDPNIRPAIWETEELMRERVHAIFPYANIIKMSDDEAQLLMPSKSEEEMARELFKMRCEILLITRGGNGASIYHPKLETLNLEPIKVKVADTTGAGDNFIAAFIYKLLELKLLDKGILNINQEEMEALSKFAHAGASLSVTQVGGMDSSPTVNEVEKVSREVVER